MIIACSCSARASLFFGQFGVIAPPNPSLRQSVRLSPCRTPWSRCRPREPLLDQEALDAVDTTLGERLIVCYRAAMIGVAFQDQVRIRLGFKVFLEVGSQSDQRLLLAGQQTAVRIFDRRLSRSRSKCCAERAGFQSTLSTGGGGGFSSVTWVDACPVRPRESVQVAFTVTGPGGTPVVFRVAELPLPEIVPALEVQLATETGTPSGLVQLADRFTVPPGDQTGRARRQRTWSADSSAATA